MSSNSQDSKNQSNSDVATDELKILRALQALSSFAASASTTTKSRDGTPELEELIQKIADPKGILLPIKKHQLSIIYQDYGEAKPRYVVVNGDVFDTNQTASDDCLPCPVNNKLILEMITNSASHDPVMIDAKELAKKRAKQGSEGKKLFEGCQNVLLVPMKLTENKHIGVFIICDRNGDKRFEGAKLGELFNIFSDLVAYFMRSNVRKRRNAALQRIQTDLMSLKNNSSSNLRGYDVINTFMGGQIDQHGSVISEGLKSWFNGVDAYLLMKHPLDTARLSLAYGNGDQATDKYRTDQSRQLDSEAEKFYLGEQRQVLENRPLIINTANEIRNKGITASCKSWAAAPLRLGKETVIGFLVVHNQKAEYAFEDGEDEILDALSDFLALLLARLYRERISESWRGIRDYQLESTDDEERLLLLYKKIVFDLEFIHGARELVIMRYDHSNLGLTKAYSNASAIDSLLANNKKKDNRFVRHISSSSNSNEFTESNFSTFEGAVLDIITNSRLLSDNNSYGHSIKTLVIQDTKTHQNYLVSPMRTKTHSIGCFIFNAPKISKFTAREVDDLSDALAKKLENYSRWKRYRLLTDFGKKIAEFGQSLSEKSVIDLAHSFIGQAMYTKNLYIALYSPRDNIIRFPLALRKGKPWIVDNGFEENIQGSERILNKNIRGKTEEIIVSGKALLHLTKKQAIEWYSQPEHKDFADNPLASWIGVPIFSEQGVIGVIASFHDNLDYIYSERDVFFLEQISFSVSGMLRALELNKSHEKLEVAYSKQKQTTNTINQLQNKARHLAFKELDGVTGMLVDVLLSNKALAQSVERAITNNNIEIIKSGLSISTINSSEVLLKESINQIERLQKIKNEEAVIIDLEPIIREAFDNTKADFLDTAKIIKLRKEGDETTKILIKKQDIDIILYAVFSSIFNAASKGDKHILRYSINEEEENIDINLSIFPFAEENISNLINGNIFKASSQLTELQLNGSISFNRDSTESTKEFNINLKIPNKKIKTTFCFCELGSIVNNALKTQIKFLFKDEIVRFQSDDNGKSAVFTESLSLAQELTNSNREVYLVTPDNYEKNGLDKNVKILSKTRIAMDEEPYNYLNSFFKG